VSQFQFFFCYNFNQFFSGYSNKMPKIDNEIFYTSAFKKYGDNAQGVCWISQERQYIRFAKLLEALPKPLDGYSIVDAGCGFGDLYSYMQKHRLTPKRYIGIEILKDFTKIAKTRTQQQILCADILTDPLPSADYYLCSGMLNTFTRFETLLALRRMLLHAKKGVVCNFLYGAKQSKIYNYISKKELGMMIQALHAECFFQQSNYLENDITVGICVPSSE